MKKVAIIGHGDYSPTSAGLLFNPPSVSVKVINEPPDQNITITGDLLKLNTYDLTPQYPITRAQRRKAERNKNKRK